MQISATPSTSTSTRPDRQPSSSKISPPSSEAEVSGRKSLIPITDEYTTFCGYLGSTDDALLLIEGSYTGLCRRTRRRLHSRDYDHIRSGAVFVFDETEANMKRWTDKLVWSPSRQIGQFFVYRQMTTKVPRGTSMRQIEEMSLAALGGISPHIDPELAAAEKPFVASLTTSPQYARDGLIKKTLCVGPYHVVSYFTLDDVQNGRLPTPSETETFANVVISPRLQAMATAAASSHSARKSSQNGSDTDDPVGSSQLSLSQSAPSAATPLSASSISWLSPVSAKDGSLPATRSPGFHPGDPRSFEVTSRDYWPAPSQFPAYTNSQSSHTAPQFVTQNFNQAHQYQPYYHHDHTANYQFGSPHYATYTEYPQYSQTPADTFTSRLDRSRVRADTSNSTPNGSFTATHPSSPHTGPSRPLSTTTSPTSLGFVTPSIKLASPAEPSSVFASTPNFGSPTVPLDRDYDTLRTSVVTVKTEIPNTGGESLESPMYADYAAPAPALHGHNLSSSLAHRPAARYRPSIPDSDSSGMTAAAPLQSVHYGHQVVDLHYDAPPVRYPDQRHPHIYNPAYFQHNVPNIPFSMGQLHGQMQPRQHYVPHTPGLPHPKTHSAEQSMDVSPLLGAAEMASHGFRPPS